MTNEELAELEALEAKATAIEEVRESFHLIHRVATGQSDRAYMSIPADPRRDADLIVSAAIDELAAARNALPRLITALREARETMADEQKNATYWMLKSQQNYSEETVLTLAAERDALRKEIQERGDDASDTLALANEAIHQLRAERDAARAEVERWRKLGASGVSQLLLSDHMGDAHNFGGMLAEALWGQAGLDEYQDSASDRATPKMRAMLREYEPDIWSADDEDDEDDE